MKWRSNWYQSWGLSKKLRYIMMGLIIPLALCMIVILCFWSWYVKRNSIVTHNVNVSSKFSIDFKENIDLKMYHYMVGSKQQEKLPIEDVEEAIELAKTLQETTLKKESKQAIRDVVDYCDNLEEKMYNIAETKSYDSRKEQLEKNIYVLTDLIQQRMMDYIYYEAGYLADIEGQMLNDMIRVIIVFSILVCILVFFCLKLAFRFAQRITQPIGQLCDNVNKVGQGVFEIQSVDSKEYEIAHLDEGINQMAKQIKILLENVKEEEKLQHKTQLQLLQAQINPHFLYNTLDTIIWMVEAGTNHEAIDMLTHLSVFFRTALSKGEDVITLEEEIKHTKSYLDIQQIRYRDILNYQITIPNVMKDIKLPKLTLQPLVENALYHGIKEKRGQGWIKINALDEEENVLIIIEDNGIGMNSEQLEKVQKGLKENESVGFGLSAVEGRLKLYFGEKYGIKIESTYGEGVTVKIHVPKKFN